MRILGLCNFNVKDFKSYSGMEGSTAMLFEELGHSHSIVLRSLDLPWYERDLFLLYGRLTDRRFWREYHQKLPFVFDIKTRRAHRMIDRMKDSIDLVFIKQGMFGAFVDEPIRPYVIFTDYNAALDKRNSHLRTFFTEHPNEAERWLHREGEMYRNARFIFTYSEYLRESMIEDYSVDPDRVVATGIGLTVKPVPANWRKDYRSKTIISTLHDYAFERKGIPNLLRAFESVKRRVPDAKLLLVGVKKERGIEQDGVHCLGQLKDRKQVEELLRESSLYVLTPLLDPTPNAIREAMAYKLPCVASDVDAIPESVLDGETGRLVPPEDPERLAEAILDLIDDPETLERMGDRGHEHVVETFSWERVVGRMESALSGTGYEADSHHPAIPCGGIVPETVSSSSG